jgi:hypothetical protein
MFLLPFLFLVKEIIPYFNMHLCLVCAIIIFIYFFFFNFVYEGISTPNNPNVPISSSSSRYIAPLDQYLLSVDAIFSSLHSDPNPPLTYSSASLFRPKRAFGAAFSLSVALLELLCPHSPARIMSFIGGPWYLFIYFIYIIYYYFYHDSVRVGQGK